MAAALLSARWKARYESEIKLSFGKASTVQFSVENRKYEKTIESGGG
jgi:hypothetical protein